MSVDASGAVSVGAAAARSEAIVLVSQAMANGGAGSGSQPILVDDNVTEGQSQAGRDEVSFVETDGMTAIAVRYAAATVWRQRTVWVSSTCNSDDLKWAMRTQLGQNVSLLRVHEGFRGYPYGRAEPIVGGPLSAPVTTGVQGPLLIVPSFGP